MKTKYAIVGLGLVFLGGFNACDVTDVSPRDSITDESFWNTTSDLRQYALGFYGNLSSPSESLDNRSDDRLPSSPDQWLFNEWTVPSTANDNSGWTWENIRNLNYFMSRYDRVSGSESEINQWVAVVRFFRALDYYSKIKTFGDVPWYEKDLTTTDTEELYKARDDRDFVLGKIIEDLEFAIEWLPEKSAADAGALHKDAARTQLARVCLHYGTYKKYHNVSTSPTSQELLQKAVDISKEIMDSGNYDIVQAPDAGSSQSSFEGYPLYYSNLFTMEDLTECSECILPRIYDEASVLMHNLARTGGDGFSKDFAETFLCTDGKPIANSSLYQGDETFDDELANRDPRMYQILDSKYRPKTVTSDGRRQITAGIGEQQEFSVSQTPGSEIHSAPGLTGGETGYNQIKFVTANQEQQLAATQSTYDWFIYRYAEVLLIRAEAECELGTINQTLLDETINKLRDRVGMPHLTMNPEKDLSEARTKYYPSGVSDLLYEIRRERRVELAGEGFRYDDIMRWNAMQVYQNPKTFVGMRVTDEMKSYYDVSVFEGSAARNVVRLSDGKEYIQMYTAKNEGDQGRVWEDSDKRMFYPIPSSEITIYNAAGYVLEQNPGWE